jgi:hypothetical protein
MSTSQRRQTHKAIAEFYEKNQPSKVSVTVHHLILSLDETGSKAEFVTSMRKVLQGILQIAEKLKALSEADRYAISATKMMETLPEEWRSDSVRSQSKVKTFQSMEDIFHVLCRKIQLLQKLDLSTKNVEDVLHWTPIV